GQEHSASADDQQKPDGAAGAAPTKVILSLDVPNTKPAAGEDNAANQNDVTRKYFLEWLKEHGVEAVGVIVVAFYTMATMSQLKVTQETNRIIIDNAKQDQRPWVFTNDVFPAVYTKRAKDGRYAAGSPIMWTVTYSNYG